MIQQAPAMGALLFLGHEAINGSCGTAQHYPFCKCTTHLAKCRYSFRAIAQRRTCIPHQYGIGWHTQHCVLHRTTTEKQTAFI